MQLKKMDCKKILVVLLLISCAIIYGALVLRGHQYVYYDIGGGDEPEQYIPLFVHFIERIKGFNLAQWTFTNGLGTSNLLMWSFLFDPFILVVFIGSLLLGIQALNTLVLLAQILNILVCGCLCYKYLSFFSGTDKAKMIASYIFALNGFIVLFSQHWVFFGFMFYALIALIILEIVLQQKNTLKPYFALALLCACVFVRSVYMGYMIAVGAVFYCGVRLFQEHTIHEWRTCVFLIWKIVCFAMLGIMASAPIMVANVDSLLVSSNRIAGHEGSFFSKIKEFLLIPYKLETLKTLFLRFSSNNLQDTGNYFIGQAEGAANDYYAPPTLFFSVFILPFIVTFYSGVRSIFDKRKNRILAWISGVLVTFIVFNKLGSAMFNAFVEPFGRYSYLLMPLFAVVTMYAVDLLLSGFKRTRVTFGISCTVLATLLMAVIVSEQNAVHYSIHILAVVDVVLLSGMVLIVFFFKNAKTTYVFLMMAVLLNIVSDSYITVNKRAFCEFSQDLVDQKENSTTRALEYIAERDKGLYRIEKDYYDLIYFHDNLLQGYNGLSTYNSTLNKNVKEFYRTYYNPAVNFYYYDSFWYSCLKTCSDITQNTLLGVKYILTKDWEYPKDMYQRIYSEEGVSVYENLAMKSFGIFYPQAVLMKDVIRLPYDSRVDLLSKAVIIDSGEYGENSSLLSYQEVKDKINEEVLWYYEDINQENENDLDIVLPLESNDIVVMNTGKRIYYLKFSTDMSYGQEIAIAFDLGDGYEKYVKSVYRGSDVETQTARVRIPEGTKNLRLTSSEHNFAIEDIRIVAQNGSILPSNEAVDLAMVREDRIKGTVQCKVPGFLFVPIPFENGWSARVDNTPVEIERANSGFMSVPLMAGNHKIEITYHYPYLQLSSRISCVAIVILLMLWLNIIKKEKYYQIKKLRRNLND